MGRCFSKSLIHGERRFWFIRSQVTIISNQFFTSSSLMKYIGRTSLYWNLSTQTASSYEFNLFCSWKLLKLYLLHPGIPTEECKILLDFVGFGFRANILGPTPYTQYTLPDGLEAHTVVSLTHFNKKHSNSNKTPCYAHEWVMQIPACFEVFHEISEERNGVGRSCWFYFYSRLSPNFSIVKRAQQCSGKALIRESVQDVLSPEGISLKRQPIE